MLSAKFKQKYYIFFSKMDRLTAEFHPLFTLEIIDALFAKQIYTNLDFIMSDMQQIVKITRLNFKEVLSIRNSLLKKFSAIPKNGFDYYKEILKHTAIIPTGIEGVDNILNGGLFTGNIYEICGLPGSGKTNFVLTAVKHILETTSQKVCLFNVKNDFSAFKLKQMFKKHKQDQQFKLLNNLLINHINSRNDLLNALYSLKIDLEANLNLRLIIIDSLPALLLNSNDYSINNSFLNYLLNILRFISTELHVTFLVTNLVTTWNDNQKEFQENIACGKYWFSAPNTRLKIKKLDFGDIYRVKILSSDSLYTKIGISADVTLTDDGFL